MLLKVSSLIIQNDAGSQGVGWDRVRNPGKRGKGWQVNRKQEGSGRTWDSQGAGKCERKEKCLKKGAEVKQE